LNLLIGENMSVYMIVEATKVIDRLKYDEYIRKVPQTVKK